MTSKSLNFSTIGIRNFLLCLITLLLPIGTWAETVTYEGEVGRNYSTSFYWRVGNGKKWNTNKDFNYTTVTLAAGESLIMTCTDMFMGSLSAFSLTTNGTAEEWADYSVELYFASSSSVTTTDKRKVGNMSYNDGTLTFVSSMGATATPTLNQEYIQVVLTNTGDTEKTITNPIPFESASLSVVCDDGVFVGDTKLTASNATTLLGTGTSYNETTHTLTLNNANFTANLLSYGINLTLSLVGENTLNGYLYGYECNGKDSGVLSLTNAMGEPSSLQMVSNSTTASVATGFTDFKYNGFEASKPDGVNSVQWSYNNSGDPHSLMYYSNGLKPVTNVTFSSYYGLEIGEVVTAENVDDVFDDGSVSYDPETKTLTLTNAEIRSDIIWGNTFDLNISIIGDNFVSGAISGSGAGTLHIIGDETGAPCSLTLDAGYNPCITDFAEVAVRGLNVSTTELGGMEVIGADPVDPMFNSRKIIFTTATLYDIWLGEERVMSTNKDNILGDEDEPTAVYNPTTNILTLNNAQFGGAYELSVPTFKVGIDLTINLVGENAFWGDKLLVTEGHTATFTTDTDNPGTLSVGAVDGNVVYQNGLSFYLPAGSDFSVIGVDDSEHYDLWIGDTQVTGNNAENVLGDYCVSWDNDNKMLSLCDATISGSIVSGIEGGITVRLAGRNTIVATNGLMPFQSTLSTEQPLTFIVYEEAEGDAVLLTKTPRTQGNAIIYSGFSEPTIPEGFKFSWDADGDCSLGEYYDLYLYTFVNGNSYFQPYYVTAANCDRLMGKYNETSETWDNTIITVSYDDSEKTLTLNNASPESAAPYGTTYFIECSGKAKNITVKLLGENKLRQHPEEGGAGFIRNNSYEGIITITTDPDNPGSLEMPGIDSYYDEDYVLSSTNPINYENGLRYSVDDKGVRHIMYHYVEDYGIAIGELSVTSENAADVREDGTVSYDSETNTLTLNGADLEDETIYYNGTDNLTIALKGENSLFQITYVNDDVQEIPQLLFTKATGATDCSLDIDSHEDCCVISGFSSVDFGPFNTTSSGPLTYGQLDPDEDYRGLQNSFTNDLIFKVVITTETSYPLWIGKTQVTPENASNVLMDNHNGVSYDASSALLTLKGVTFDGAIIAGSGIANLTVHLVGYNMISNYNDPVIVIPETSTLTVTTSTTLPGSLTLCGARPQCEILYRNGLAMGQDINDYNIICNEQENTEVVSFTGCVGYVSSEETTSYIYSSPIEFYASSASAPGEKEVKVSTKNSSTEATMWPTYLEAASILSKMYVQLDWGACTNHDVTVQVKGLSQNDGEFEPDGKSYSEAISLSSLDNDGIIEIPLTSRITSDNIQLVFASENAFSFFPLSIAFQRRDDYGLTVAGVAVNEENMENITGDLIVGDGTVSFDPETNTLFMTGDVLIGNGGVAWNGNGDLTIQFVGTENRISSLTTNAVYSTSADAAFNLILQEGSDEAPCELTLQTPENTGIIGSGFTKVYREVSRLVDYNLTVTAQDATGAPAQWHALCVTTQFDAPVLWLDPDSETPKAVVSLGLFPGATFERQYNDVTLYTSTDGRNFNVYTEPVAVSVASPMIYARAQVRNVVSPIARGKYIGFAPQTSTVLVGTSFTPEMTQIGNGDGLSFNPDAVVYESSNPNVALFTDGVVTTVGVGTVTLTANIQQAVDVADETSYAYPLVVNDGILSFNLAVSPIDYNIWVKGIRVNSANKDNVLNDANATVRFNPVTNSLLFYGANVSINPGDTTSLVRCALSEGLTVELRGTNTLAFSAGFRNMLNTNVPLTFTTNDTKPGQLSWTIQNDVEGFFSTGFNIGYEADLELQTSGDLISVTPPVDYGLLIGSTVVTSVNCTDILGDGTVKYTDANKTLVLNDATLTVPVVSGLSQLKVYLQGESTISGTENMLSSSVANAPLTFTTSASAPGKLTLIKTKDSGNWISGFATPSYDSPLGHTKVGNSMAVLDPASIAPIVNEENPTAEVTLTDPTDPNHPDNPVVNEVIDDVIYNLPANSFDEGSGTPEDPAGAILDEVVVKDETFYENNEPGTDGFAAGFTGLVFMLAPGTGDIQIDANIREGNKLAVQIGLSDPVLLPNEDYPTVNEMATYYVPFAVTDRTYVYVYLAETPAPSRSMSEMPNREKVLHGHVKVTQLGVAASSMVNNNVYSEQENNVGRKVKLYSLPSSAVADGGNGIVLSTVALADAAASRAASREASPEVYPITELAPTVFDALDKSKVLYIDMKGTALEDFTVNRTKGIMSGFSSNTLIYLPDKNDDGGEPNVVINKECARLSLNSDSKFRSPMAFTAAEATLNRTFTVGRTSTVFLPFALTKAQADALGAFYTFDKIEGDDAVFNPAETNGIEANKPYIFTPAAEHVSATNVAVVQVNEFFATQGNLIGTYEQIVWDVDPGNIYGFAAADDGGIKGGQFVRAAAGAWIPPFRAYLQVDNASSRLNIVISEQEPDDIREFSISREDANAAYDLQGRKVSDTKQKTSALKAGLYIINGKKTIVK